MAGLTQPPRLFCERCGWERPALYQLDLNSDTRALVGFIDCSCDTEDEFTIRIGEMIDEMIDYAEHVDVSRQVTFTISDVGSRVIETNGVYQITAIEATEAAEAAEE